jgi:protein N-terminal methyltransferase
MALMPELCTVPSALRPLKAPPRKRRVRALDVGVLRLYMHFFFEKKKRESSQKYTGAGVGRVTGDTLLPLVDDVVLVEPVEPFVRAAFARGKASEAPSDPSGGPGPGPAWRGVRERAKGVSVVQCTLQALDPADPLRAGSAARLLGTVGRALDEGEMESGFDVAWCQWCLGHLSDEELIDFFGRVKGALRTRDVAAGESASLIVVKENCCSDGANGEPRSSFDEEDSSLTRYV